MGSQVASVESNSEQGRVGPPSVLSVVPQEQIQGRWEVFLYLPFITLSGPSLVHLPLAFSPTLPSVWPISPPFLSVRTLYFRPTPLRFAWTI